MFRVPVSPLFLNKPKLSLPPKSASQLSRRFSDTSKQRRSKLPASQPIMKGAVVEKPVLESDGEEDLKYMFRENAVEKKDGKGDSVLGRPTQKVGRKKRRLTEDVQEFIPGKQDDKPTSAQSGPKHHVAFNSPFTYESEQHEVSDNEAPSQRKRKQSADVIDDVPDSGPKKHKKRRKSAAKLTDIVDEEEDGLDVDKIVSISEGQGLSKKERKELKRQRKEERKKRREQKAERKRKEALYKGEQEETFLHSDDDEEPNLKALNDIPSSSAGALSQEIPLDPPSGKPSRKKQKPQRNLEIAVTQELPSAASSSIRHSSPEGTPLPEPKRRSLLSLKSSATKKKTKKSSQPNATSVSSDAEENPAAHASDETGGQEAEAQSALVSMEPSAEGHGEFVAANTQAPGSSSNLPRGQRRRQVSNQRIYDSSADEEQLPPIYTPKKRKVGDLIKHQKGQPSAEAEPADGTVHRKFTSEEDARLKQVIFQYEKRENVTRENFLEQLRGKREDAEFMVDVELEEWNEARTPEQLFQRIRYLNNIIPHQPSDPPKQSTSSRRRSSNTKLYDEAEDTIIKNSVKGYLQLEKITKEEFAALLESDAQTHYSKRKSRDFLKELAQQLPHRSVLSVTRHLMKLYPVEQYEKFWTLEDDTKLKKLVALHGKQWTKIAPELGRSSELVRLRYKDYTSWGEKRNKGSWKEDEIWRFNEAVVERLGELGKEKDSWTRMEREEISGMFDWNGVSELVKTRSRLQCRSRWIQLGFLNVEE